MNTIAPNDLAMLNIYGNWGLPVTTPPSAKISTGTGISVSDYTTRFINPIMGDIKTAMTSQQRYYAGYIIIIGVGFLGLWLYNKKGGKIL